MGALKELTTLLAILGIPSIFAMSAWCIKACILYGKQLKVLMQAQQAQMRKELLKDYEFYIDGGWISNEHMEDWENRYQAYHLLGANGILDAKRDELLRLPSKPPVIN